MKRLLYTRENLAVLLRQHGVHPTHQRIEIAHALFSLNAHLCADQVLAQVNLRHPETSRATVYNTLNLFVRKGLIREVIADPSRVFYDPNTHPHYHLYDSRTGRLTDIDAQSIQITGLPALPPGVVAEGVDVIVRVRSSDAAE
ncbi:MAG TPA: transcriptional repressor [Burkholderiales bacterium]|nr:transcriptional repressor [Burkholderiales bacterium]